jgi:hypothetical protein
LELTTVTQEPGVTDRPEFARLVRLYRARELTTVGPGGLDRLYMSGQLDRAFRDAFQAFPGDVGSGALFRLVDEYARLLYRREWPRTEYQRALERTGSALEAVRRLAGWQELWDLERGIAYAHESGMEPELALALRQKLSLRLDGFTARTGAPLLIASGVLASDAMMGVLL